jgi:hypothetical protein
MYWKNVHLNEASDQNTGNYHSGDRLRFESRRLLTLHMKPVLTHCYADINVPGEPIYGDNYTGPSHPLTNQYGVVCESVIMGWQGTVMSVCMLTARD